jgi:hypothetical protein
VLHFLHALGGDHRGIVEDLRHLVAHELRGRTVRHAAGEAPLEEPGRSRQHEPAQALGRVEREIEGDVAAQRVPDDDGRRQALGVHERLDVGPEPLDREIVRRRLEDGQGQRHRPAAGREGLDGRLPVLAGAEQPVEAQDRNAGPGLDPAELRHRTRLVHAVLLAALTALVRVWASRARPRARSGPSSFRIVRMTR